MRYQTDFLSCEHLNIIVKEEVLNREISIRFKDDTCEFIRLSPVVHVDLRCSVLIRNTVHIVLWHFGPLHDFPKSDVKSNWRE